MSKAPLLASAAAFAVLGAVLPATAQTPAKPAAETPSGPPRMPDVNVHGQPGPDGLSHDELYIEADSVVRDDDHRTLTARGRVEARYQHRTLRADEVVYNTDTGLVTANGHVQIINPDGTVDYAEHVELDKNVEVGVARGFATRLKPMGEWTKAVPKISAAAAVRPSPDVTVLDKAVFTPCPICAPDGRPIEPTWSIQAAKIVEDKPRNLIFYRNAVIKVKGVPIFFTPILWTPDPTAKATSGLLTPIVSLTQRRGFSWEQPYLWVISPSADLLISPQFNTKIPPFLNLDAHARLWSSVPIPQGSDTKPETDIRAGYTYAANSNSQGEQFGPETSRSYVLAGGAFQIDRSWLWGFSAERASDPRLFDRYDIPNVQEHRGLYDDDPRRLTSQLYAVRQDDDSFVSVDAVDFQTIRPFVNVNGQPLKNPVTGELAVENQNALPAVVPKIEAHWSPHEDVLGGRLSLAVSSVGLFQTNLSLDPLDPPVDGVNVGRLTGQIEWRTSLFTSAGVRIDPYLSARGDYYSADHGIDFDPTRILQPIELTGPFTLARGSATIGVDVTYPLAKAFPDGALVIEPIAQLALSPRAIYDPRLLIEDSFSVTVDETNLFTPNRFTGFDLYEGGARLNTGVRASYDWDSGRWAWVEAGRSFRSNANFPTNIICSQIIQLDQPCVLQGEQLNNELNSWVFAAEASPAQGLTGFGRVNVQDDGSVRRIEIGANWDYSRTRGLIRYYKDEFDPFAPGFRAQDIEAAADVMFTRRWGIIFDVTRDLDKGLWRRSQAGLLYQDDCIRAELTYQRNETGLLGPSDAVFLRLFLATMGDTGYRRYDDR
jgi:LPS-assembly protein